MKNSKYLIYNTANFQFRLIQRTEQDLVWDVDLANQKSNLATIQMDANGNYILFVERPDIGLSVEWMKELSDFLELVNLEQNPLMIRYKCANCGNTCLQQERPDNSICGGCDSPNWKIMKFQESYIQGQADWVHQNGEI